MWRAAARPRRSDWPGLILEVPEGEVVKDVALFHEIATQLRIYGITLAIDDYVVAVDEHGGIMACGALKELTPTHAEVKSMRTPNAVRRRGAGRAMLVHILEQARARGYQRLSLETGAQAEFEPARRLFASAGFQPCGRFGDYTPDPYSFFMTLEL